MTMQPAPGGHRHPAIILGGAAVLAAAIIGVPFGLAGTGGTPSAERLAMLMLPSLLGAAGLAFLSGIWLGRRRRAQEDGEVLAAGQSRLALAQTQARLAAERAATAERRIAALMDLAGPGAALFDAKGALFAWNRGFAALAEVPEAALHAGLPLAELARLQPAGPGRRLPVSGLTAGIATAAQRQRSDGSRVEDRWTPWPTGEVLLACTPMAAPRTSGALSQAALAALCEEEVRSRLPRLQAAVASGDAVQARAEAHAIRGVAAGFGMEALARALCTVEEAARAGDLAAMAAGSLGLAEIAEDGLRRLPRHAA